MIPAKIEVQLNNEEIQKLIDEKIKEMVRQEVLFVDVESLVKLTSFSKEFLEQNILNHPKVAIHMRRKSRKRVYYFKEVMESIRWIADNEWQ